MAQLVKKKPDLPEDAWLACAGLNVDDPEIRASRETVTDQEIRAEALIKVGERSKAGSTYSIHGGEFGLPWSTAQKWEDVDVPRLHRERRPAHKSKFAALAIATRRTHGRLSYRCQRDLERRCEKGQLGSIPKSVEEAIKWLGELAHRERLGRPAKWMDFQNRRGVVLIGLGPSLKSGFWRLAQKLPVMSEILRQFTMGLFDAVVETRLRRYVNARLQSYGPTGGDETTVALQAHRDGRLLQHFYKNDGGTEDVILLRFIFSWGDGRLRIYLAASKKDRTLATSKAHVVVARHAWDHRSGALHLLDDELNGQARLAAFLPLMLGLFPFHELEALRTPAEPGMLTTRSIAILSLLAPAGGRAEAYARAGAYVERVQKASATHGLAGVAAAAGSPAAGAVAPAQHVPVVSAAVTPSPTPRAPRAAAPCAAAPLNTCQAGAPQVADALPLAPSSASAPGAAESFALTGAAPTCAPPPPPQTERPTHPTQPPLVVRAGVADAGSAPFGDEEEAAAAAALRQLEVDDGIAVAGVASDDNNADDYDEDGYEDDGVDLPVTKCDVDDATFAKDVAASEAWREHYRKTGESQAVLVAREAGKDVAKAYVNARARDAYRLRSTFWLASPKRETYYLGRECRALAHALSRADARYAPLFDADVVDARVAAMAATHYLGGPLEYRPWASLERTLDRLNVPLLRESAYGGHDIEPVRLLRRARDAVERIAREDHLIGKECDALVGALSRADASYASLRGASVDAVVAAVVSYLDYSRPSMCSGLPSTDQWASLRHMLDRLDARLPSDIARWGLDIEKVRLLRCARGAVEPFMPRRPRVQRCDFAVGDRVLVGGRSGSIAAPPDNDYSSFWMVRFDGEARARSVHAGSLQRPKSGNWVYLKRGVPHRRPVEATTDAPPAQRART